MAGKTAVCKKYSRLKTNPIERNRIGGNRSGA
jgi:hypothetical protein